MIYSYSTDRTFPDVEAFLSDYLTGSSASRLDSRLDALSTLGEELSSRSTAVKYPDLVALGFFLRRRRLERLVSQVTAEENGRVRVARGLIFHVPPANVDAVFAYSWAISFLIGNRNIVRVSERCQEGARFLLRCIAEVLEDNAAQHGQSFISFERNIHTVQAISGVADLRVLWGGDETVTSLKLVPSGPRCRDLVFSDRHSWAAISASSFCAADDASREKVVGSLLSDALWSSQLACSSPRAIAVTGDPIKVEEARKLLIEEFSKSPSVIEHAKDARLRMDRLVGLTSSLMSRRVGAGSEVVPGITFLEPADYLSIDRDFRGTGTFTFVSAPSLIHLLPMITLRDQTLVYFGYTKEELKMFASRSGTSGIDRIVPFGSALEFDEVWDGEDLLTEFSRLVTVR